MIPRILHQTWKTERIPPEWRDARESWRAAHPAWEHRLWTDRDLDALVREHAPDFYPFWLGYPDHIQRVDSARYVILTVHGGVYADLDMVCLRPLDGLLQHDLVLPRTTPLGLSNQLMMARPGHPLFREALEALPGAYRRWQRRAIPRHFRILLTTGPLFLTGCYRRHEGDTAVRLLSREEHGHGRPENSCVAHLRGRTWAARDTHVFNFVHDHWRKLAVGALMGAGGVAALVAALTP